MAQESALEVFDMSISGVDSNAQLIAWASQHTAAMGKTMEDAMEGGDARQDELSQLAKIQSSLEQAKSESNPNYLNQAKAELEQLFADHPDMKSSLGDLYNQVSTADFNFRTKDGTQDYSTEKDYGDPVGAKAWKEADDTVSASLGSDGAWSTMLTAANDSIKKADDKGMLDIQNLNSEIQQAQQLASGLVSSNNQTSMSVIRQHEGLIMIGIGSGISTWDLVAWASQHTAGMNQQMSGMMNDADTRQDEQEAISKIKEQLSAAGSDPTRVEQAKKDLDQLLQDHPELSGDLGGLKSSLDFESQQVASGAQTTDDFKTNYANYSGAGRAVDDGDQRRDRRHQEERRQGHAGDSGSELSDSAIAAARVRA